ncbi:MAG: hypothetical protein IKO35_00730, partial [Elusimicrobiaceae bacterium]|nr:hypothetical protein [Elusimicrobiaceae bacterium]
MVTLNLHQLPSSTFACGPSQAHPALRQIPLYQTRFERNHRAPDIVHFVYEEAAQQLRRLLQLSDEYTLCFFPGGANAAMDAVLWNLTKDTLSGLAFGEFSNRWAHAMANVVPGLKNTVRFTQPKEFFPNEEPNYQASLIILTPNETSTGVQIPSDYLSRVWTKRGPDTLVA